MLIREYPITINTGDNAYLVRIHGTQRPDGTWKGWIEFQPSDPSQPIWNTDQETSQPSLAALEYWADGLEPVYLDGALARAQGRLP
jgi:hypothetical protein